MATATVTLHVRPDSTIRRYVNHGIGQLLISEPDDLYGAATVSFSSGGLPAWPSAIHSCDRLIAALQDLRAAMLRQAVASDPAYAEAK